MTARMNPCADAGWVRSRQLPAGLTGSGGALALLLALPLGVASQEKADFFKQNCASCHTIGGGKLTGPDLKGVVQRARDHGKDRDWLANFILDPKAMLDGGDEYALTLKRQFANLEMPRTFGITRPWAEKMLELIEEESAKPQSIFGRVAISERAFTAADRELGRDIFLGYASLANGGPSCISCHSAGGAGALGGGRLGPDLTRVFERQGGRKQLSAWLSAPATPTMQPVYKNHPLTPEEILPLAAYFEELAQHGREDGGVAPFNFFLLGLGGTVLALVGFDVLWRRRFRAVRRTLVHGETPTP